MDDEIAAKHVLLDFELVALIALAMGVLVYRFAHRLRRATGPEDGLSAGSVDYDGFDLVLMFFPAMFFLVNPIAEVLLTKTAAAPRGTEETKALDTTSALLTIVFFGFVGVMTYGLIEWVRNRRVSDLFGLRRLRLANIIVISILGGVFSLLLCGWIVGDFSSHFIEGLFGELELQAPVQMLQESNSFTHLALSIGMACVAAPLVEEFLFRGYMYGTLRQLTHPVFAAVVVGALFAVVHGNLPALLPLWVFSLLLCLAYEWSGCLWVPVGMHVFFNAANIVLMLMPEAAP